MVYLPPDQREKLAHILLDIEDAERSEKLLSDLVVDVNGSRSAEALIRACSVATTNSLFDHVILPRIVELSKNNRANYVVQMFLSRITDAELVERAFQALRGELEVIYNANNRGILLQTLNACRRTSRCEKECFSVVLTILRHVLHMDDADASMDSFVEKALNIQKEGGRVKINEIFAQYVLESMLCSAPIGCEMTLPLLKLPVETLLRVGLSCSVGRSLIGAMVGKMETKDQTVWKSVLVGDCGDGER